MLTSVFMWKHWSRAAAALGVIAVVVSAGFGKEWPSIFFSHVSEPLKNVNAIVQSRIEPQVAPELFVHRPMVEQKLLDWFTAGVNTTLIVYGPRGAGKTTLVHNALVNRTGIINVGVSPASPSIACQVVKLLRLTSENGALLCDEMTDLKQLFVNAQAKLNGSLPVIVVDVAAEPENAEQLANLVVRQAKRLVVDKQMARCILVFSDASVVFALNEHGPSHTVVHRFAHCGRSESIP
jgi:hypothetical protein